MITLPQLHPEYIMDKDGNKKSVIIPLVEFESLLEDFEDLIALSERKNEPSTPHDEFLKELKQDGLL